MGLKSRNSQKAPHAPPPTKSTHQFRLPISIWMGDSRVTTFFQDEKERHTSISSLLTDPGGCLLGMSYNFGVSIYWLKKEQLLRF